MVMYFAVNHFFYEYNIKFCLIFLYFYFIIWISTDYGEIK